MKQARIDSRPVDGLLSRLPLVQRARPATPEQIMASQARTSFNFAARFLPDQQRQAVTDLYAFFRTLDDLVDQPASDRHESAARMELSAWRTWFDDGWQGSGPREPLAGNLSTIIAEYDIPVSTFLHLIDGLESDIGPREIETTAELDLYCYQMASTVGIAMTHVLGATSPKATAAASQLGAAMQLTNILRDIGEDLTLDHVYLPKNQLAHYGLCREDLIAMQRNGGPDDRLRSLMQYQIAVARQLYQEGIAGIWLLPSESRFPILIAARLYRRLLSLIEEANYDTLRRRIATSRRDKLKEYFVSQTLVTLWHHDERTIPEPVPASPIVPTSGKRGG